MNKKIISYGRGPFPPRHKPEKRDIFKLTLISSWQEALANFIGVLMMYGVLVIFFKILVYLGENGRL